MPNDTIEALIDAVITREGGFVDHPDDRGNATRWGITECVARAAGYIGPMAALPRTEARRIYRQQYWDEPGYGEIAKYSPVIAAELFDTGINMGVKVAAGFLQRALNALNRHGRDYADIIVDHVIGPATLAALSTFLERRAREGETILLKALNALQGERYIALAERRPANESFLYGWIRNRIG